MCSLIKVSSPPQSGSRLSSFFRRKKSFSCRMTQEHERVISKMLTEPPPKEIAAAVEHLKEWLVQEPHLPNVSDEDWLRTYYYRNKFSLEKTKSKLENYYTLRNKYPHILKNRDPTAPWVANYWPDFCLSKQLTADDSRIIMIKYDLDVSLFNGDDFCKFSYMLVDLLVLENDKLPSVLHLIDMRSYTYSHFLKTLSGLKLVLDYFIKAGTSRVEAIHIFNAPSFIEIILGAMSAILPEKLLNRMIVNTASKNTFLEKYDKNDLPSDLGGTGPSWAECGEWTRKKLEQHRKWFIEQDNVCANEQLRRKGDNQLEEMKGSFKKLEVD